MSAILSEGCGRKVRIEPIGFPKAQLDPPVCKSQWSTHAKLHCSKAFGQPFVCEALQTSLNQIQDNSFCIGRFSAQET